MTLIRQVGIVEVTLFFIFNFHTSFSQQMILNKCLCEQKVLADSLFKKGEYISAKKIYKKLLKSEQSLLFHTEIELKIGHCYFANKKFRKGFRQIEFAFKMGGVFVPNSYNPDNESSLSELRQNPKKYTRFKQLYEKNNKLLQGKNSKLREKLFSFKLEDQKYRKTPKEMDRLSIELDLPIDSLLKKQNKIDLNLRNEIASILDSLDGWPKIHQVGVEGIGALWLIVQHSDDDVNFQKKCLYAMEKGLKSGTGLWLNYAYLYDRIAVNTKNPQYFYTQFEEIIKDSNGRYIDILFKNNHPDGDLYRKCISFPSVFEYKSFVLKRWNKD
jgi:hypothetical protein